MFLSRVQTPNRAAVLRVAENLAFFATVIDVEETNFFTNSLWPSVAN